MTVDIAKTVAAAQQGLSKEEILAAHPNDAQIDMVTYIEDMILTAAYDAAGAVVKPSLTDEQQNAIATKMVYWCRLFYSQGALKFQQAYEKKVRELAEKRADGKRIVERQGLFVPFKYKGKTK
jgi:hypothetical protein